MAFNPGAFIANINSLERRKPNTRFDFANAWANAYFAGYGNPTPPSLTNTVAKQAMFGLFMLAYENNDNGKKFMNAAVSIFAVSMAPGMLPLWAAKPPLNYRGFEQVNIDNVTTEGSLGPALAAVTSPWFASGTATQTVTGATTTWL